MTLEEFKNLSEEEFDKFQSENEEEFDELMSAAFSEANEKYSGKVFEADCVYFVLNNNGVFEISDDAGCSPRGGWFPEIVSGPSEEDKEAVESLMAEYRFDEDLFSDISDWPDEEDWDSDSVEEYLEILDEDDDDDNEKINKINIIIKLQQAVNEGSVSFESVNDIYLTLKKYDLDSDALYYEWEGEYIDFYDNVSECGECRGEYDDLSDYEWIQILQNLDEHIVTAD